MGNRIKGGRDLACKLEEGRIAKGMGKEEDNLVDTAIRRLIDGGGYVGFERGRGYFLIWALKVGEVRRSWGF